MCRAGGTPATWSAPSRPPSLHRVQHTAVHRQPVKARAAASASSPAPGDPPPLWSAARFQISSALSKRSLAVEVDGQRVPAAVLGYLGVHHEILNLDLAKSIDGVGHPPQERRYVSLALTSRIGLAEVLYDPRRPLAHPSSLPSRVRSCRDDGRLAAVGACYVLPQPVSRPDAVDQPRRPLTSRTKPSTQPQAQRYTGHFDGHRVGWVIPGRPRQPSSAQPQKGDNN